MELVGEQESLVYASKMMSFETGHYAAELLHDSTVSAGPPQVIVGGP